MEGEVAAAAGTLQRLQDGVGVVVRAWTKEGLPSRPNLMALGPAHDPSWSVVRKAPGGLEPEAPRVLDRAEHQMLRQPQRRLERLAW